MSDFLQPKVPVWRLALYGVLGLGVACWIGIRQGSGSLVIAAAIAIPLLILVILGVFQLGRNPHLLRWWPLILLLYAACQLGLLYWDLLPRPR